MTTVWPNITRLIFLASTAALLLVLSACNSNSPAACFQIASAADSLHVGKRILFDAHCSSDASAYYWDFGNGQTGPSTVTASTLYDSAASYQVTLVVSNGSKTATTAHSVTILP